MTQKLGLGAIVKANWLDDEEGYEQRLWVQEFADRQDTIQWLHGNFPEVAAAYINYKEEQ